MSCHHSPTSKGDSFLKYVKLALACILVILFRNTKGEVLYHLLGNDAKILRCSLVMTVLSE